MISISKTEIFTLRAPWKIGAKQRNRISNTCAIRSIASITQKQEVANVQIPDHLKNYVAALEISSNGHCSKCYVLGISHVSKNSCTQVRDLIEAVRPDVVMVELCKDRVGLLVDRDSQDTDTWHARKVSLEGATFSEIWPSPSALLSLLKTKLGYPIKIPDVEDDSIRLLSTGLFSCVRPAFSRASNEDAPAFIPKFFNGQIKVQTVPPLGEVKFEVKDRVFPPIVSISIRVDSSLKELHLSLESLESYCEKATEESKSGEVSLTCYLRLRKRLLDECRENGGVDAVVTFTGEDTGRVDIVLRNRRKLDPLFISGFEEGASNGNGWGIEPFKPARRPFKLSEGMYIPIKALEDLLERRGVWSKTEEDILNEKNLIENISKKKTEFKLWPEDQISNSKSKEQNKNNIDAIADLFGQAVTGLYAKFQSEAGRKVGVDAGAAWREALFSSVSNSVSQIHLFDIPESISRKKLAESIMLNMGLRIGISITFLSSVLALLNAGFFPEDFVGSISTATVVGTLALLWPVIGPYIEVARFSSLSAEEIEEQVSLNVPIQSDLDTVLKIFGEDALLDWPGAYDPLIRERDEYMARNMFLTAKGMSNSSPAYIQDICDSDIVLRLLSPSGAPEQYAPLGTGDGCFEQGLTGDLKIVSVVGSAHVRGICKEWELLNQKKQEELDINNLFDNQSKI